jgi:hypothetical protein
LSFFSSFLSFFLAAWLPAAACCESSSALAFFTLFNFPNCFLLVGILLPRSAFGVFYLPFFLLINIPVSLYQPVRVSNKRKAGLFNCYFTIFISQYCVIKKIVVNSSYLHYLKKYHVQVSPHRGPRTWNRSQCPRPGGALPVRHPRTSQA